MRNLMEKFFSVCRKSSILLLPWPIVYKGCLSIIKFTAFHCHFITCCLSMCCLLKWGHLFVVRDLYRQDTPRAKNTHFIPKPQNFYPQRTQGEALYCAKH